MAKVGTFAAEDVAEIVMPRAGRPTKHKILAVDLARKHNAISVERQKSIFELVKIFEIKSVSYAYCRAM